MKILHVVSGLAPDLRFGGISRVTLDLAREQRRRGHQVRVVSTDIGFARPVPPALEGVPVTLLRSLHAVPRLGFGTILSPGLIPLMIRATRGADLVHVHVAREPNTLLAAAVSLARGVPLVLQTHGMLDAPSNPLAHLVDAALTRPVLARATVALTLTGEEDAEVARLSKGALAGTRFPNGVDLVSVRAAPVAKTSVLFLSRLHPRKGAIRFVEAAVRIASDLPDARFVIVGPDEGDGPAVRHRIEENGTPSVVYVGPVAHAEVRGHMERAALYCLPAEGEPFGLTVLEALAAETPVLLHESAALAPEIEAAEAGWTFAGTDDRASLEHALRHALADGDELRRRGVAARRLVHERFGLPAVVERLEDVYRSTIARSDPRRPFD